MSKSKEKTAQQLKWSLAVLKDLELLIGVNAHLTDGSPIHKTIKLLIKEIEEDKS